MNYQITITRKRTVTKLVKGEWAVVGTEEVGRKREFYDPPAEKDEPKTIIMELRGYTPDREMPVEETTEILSQTVDELNLVDVIKAINKIP